MVLCRLSVSIHRNQAASNEDTTPRLTLPIGYHLSCSVDYKQKLIVVIGTLHVGLEFLHCLRAVHIA